MNSTSSQDCYYFYYSNCNKGLHCPYRHCEAALGSEYQCPDWQAGQCYDTNCSFRHMQIEKKRNDIACYWESQAGGCRKPHCVFLHNRPRDAAGTILSEEEKLEAITSPPPQMAMPMADGPSPHDLYYDALPQDNIRNSDSPAVEKVIINPFEEETDEESLYGTPVKNEIGQRTRDLQVPSNLTRKPVLRAIPAQETQPVETTSEDLNFSVKSLEQIRQEKLDRAKKLIEEADKLFSGEDMELEQKVAQVKKKIVTTTLQQSRPPTNRTFQPLKSTAVKSGARELRAVSPSATSPNIATATVTANTKMIKVNLKSAASDLPEVKSYEEILREKALASMMAAKAKKLVAKEDEERKAREEIENSKQRGNERQAKVRRVIVRRRSDSPTGQVGKPTALAEKKTIHARLGDSNIRSRLGVPEQTEQGVKDRIVRPKTVVNTKPSNIKSRLGLSRDRPEQQKPDFNDEDSRSENIPRNIKKPTYKQAPQPSTKINVKDRLGIKLNTGKALKETHNSLPSKLAPNVHGTSQVDKITMSDFSSDGLSDDTSEDEDEEVLREKQKILMDKLAAIDAKKKPKNEDKSQKGSNDSDQESKVESDLEEEELQESSDAEAFEENQNYENNYSSEEDDMHTKNKPKKESKKKSEIQKKEKQRTTPKALVAKVKNKVKQVPKVITKVHESSEEESENTASEDEEIKQEIPKKRTIKSNTTVIHPSRQPIGIKRKIIIECKDDHEYVSPSKRKLKAIPSKKTKVSPKNKTSGGRRVMLANSESDSENLSEEEKYSEESDRSTREQSYSEDISEDEEQEEEPQEDTKKESRKVQPKTKIVQKIVTKAELKVPIKTTHTKTKKLSPEKREKKTSRLQLYIPPALKLQGDGRSSSRNKPVKILTVKDRLHLNKKREVSSDEYSDNSVDSETRKPLHQTVTMRPVMDKSVSRKNKGWAAKSYSEILQEKQSKSKRSVSPSSDFDEPDYKSAKSGKRTKLMFSPISFGSNGTKNTNSSLTRINVTDNTRTVSPGSFEDELINYRSHQQQNKPSHKYRDSTERSYVKSVHREEKDEEQPKRSGIWSTRSRNSNKGDSMTAVSQIAGTRKLSIHKRLGDQTRASVRKEESIDDENLFNISTPKVNVRRNLDTAIPQKVRSPIMTGRSPLLRQNAGKSTSGSLKITSTKPRSAEIMVDAPKLKSPSGRRSSRDAVASSKPSIPPADDTTVTKADMAAMLDHKLNPSDPVVDNELNLDDTDQLEAELLELLGGSDSSYKMGDTMGTASYDNNEEDELLLQELLS